MAKPRKKSKKNSVSLAATPWDTGPNTEAQNRMKIVESADYIDPETGKKVNPNGVKRARRVDMLEVYFRRGVIDAAQFNAGERLRNAWEATQKSPPAIKPVQVDCSPKPDATIDMQIARMSSLHAIASFVRPQDRAVIDAVVYRGVGVPFTGRNHAKGLQALRDALAHIADMLEKRR